VARFASFVAGWDVSDVVNLTRLLERLEVDKHATAERRAGAPGVPGGLRTRLRLAGAGRLTRIPDAGGIGVSRTVDPFAWRRPRSGASMDLGPTAG